MQLHIWSTCIPTRSSERARCRLPSGSARRSRTRHGAVTGPHPGIVAFDGAQQPSPAGQSAKNPTKNKKGARTSVLQPVDLASVFRADRYKFQEKQDHPQSVPKASLTPRRRRRLRTRAKGTRRSAAARRRTRVHVGVVLRRLQKPESPVPPREGLLWSCPGRRPSQAILAQARQVWKRPDGEITGDGVYLDPVERR